MRLTIIARICSAAMLLGTVCRAFAAAPKVELINETVALPLESNAGMVSWPGVVQLTRDGKHMLYSRILADSNKSSDRPLEELVLRDLTTGHEIVLPSGKFDNGVAQQLIASQPIDPSGKYIALPDYSAQAPTTAENGSPIIVYQIANGRIYRPRVRAFAPDVAVMPIGPVLLTSRFGLFRLTDGKQASIGVQGFVQSISPTMPIAAFIRSRAQPGGAKNILWDLARNRLIADLPMNRNNSLADDFSPQWSADGSLVYYVDNDPHKSSWGDTHIWDLRKAGVIATVENAVPLSPGPGPRDMFLRRRVEPDGHMTYPIQLLLYDFKSRSTCPVPVTGDRVLDACGAKIAYVKSTAGKEEPDVLCTAEVKVAR